MSRRCHRPLGISTALALVIWAGTAQAACTVSGTGPAFGVYSSEALLTTDAVGEARIRCTGAIGLLVSYTLSLSTGQSGTYTPRRMAGPGSASLSYQVYRDLTRLQVWGDGSAGTSLVTGGALLAIGSFTVVHSLYASILARQRVAAGSYSDTLTLVVTY